MNRFLLEVKMEGKKQRKPKKRIQQQQLIAKEKQQQSVIWWFSVFTLKYFRGRQGVMLNHSCVNWEMSI